MNPRTSARATRIWTRFYTSWLPPAQRERRRAEVDSDLWESLSDKAASTQILSRLLHGAADDLTWSVIQMERNARDGFWWSVGSVLTVSFVMLWIAFTPDGTAIVSVSWVWPTAAILHVLGLIALIALRIVIDLRLTTRALDAMPVPELVRRLTPVTVVAAAFTIVSGLVLYMMGDSARFAANPMFQAKLVMLAGALATLWYMHAVILRSAHHWDSAAAPPRHARLAGFVSLTLWAFVVVFSMLTPYAY